MSEAGISRSNWLTWAGLAGAAFVGYAIYFDYKRRSAPDYKQKVRENRRRKALRKGGRVVAARGNPMGLPDPRNPASMQAFFLQEVQLGEELMAAGNVEQGALHIANAIILCGQSQQLMTIFEQTLPPEQFAAVLQVLPSARAQLSAAFGSESDEPADSIVVNNDENHRLADMFETAADDLDQGPVIDGSFIQMSSGEPNFSSEPRRSGIEVTELIDEELE